MRFAAVRQAMSEGLVRIVGLGGEGKGITASTS